MTDETSSPASSPAESEDSRAEASQAEDSQAEDSQAEASPPAEIEIDGPNEFGFAGAATAPEPEETPGSEESMGESIAVPAGDLTGAITEAIEEFTDRDDDSGKGATTEPR